MLYPVSKASEQTSRVVVTGVGIVTALGSGWKSNAEGFRSGRRAFRAVSRFDVTRQRVKVAAEGDVRGPVETGGLSARHAARLDHSGKLLLAAAQEAWWKCAWEVPEDLPL